MNIEVSVDYLPVINFSMQQNHVPVIRAITVRNQSDEELTNLSIAIEFDPIFAEPTTLHIDHLGPDADTVVEPVAIQLSTSYLSALTERVRGSIKITVTAGETTLFTDVYDIALLAFDQWGGLAVLPEMLAAFVTPNQPEIAPIIKRASEILEGWTDSPTLDEYQTRDPNQVKKQMAAVYEAIAERRIAYCSVPASFEESGQRVRLYADVLANGLGNCLEMTLLYAGCLEAIGIHPLIIVMKGHAFVGGWLIPDSFSDSVSDDVSLLTKRTADGINEIIALEATCMNAGKNVPFDAAVAVANDRLRRTDDFLLVIDVLRARNGRIRPLPQRVVRDGVVEIKEEPEIERRNDAPEMLSATEIVTTVDHISVGKQTIWERKLLDLTLRNSLLNMRITRNILQLISVNISELEDVLAEGAEFQILGKPTDWDNPLMNAGIYQTLNGSDPVFDLVESEFRQKRLRSYLTDDALHIALTHLYRSSRLALEENGANTLYLALGLLKWYETPASTHPRFAPIILLPIEIIRKSASKGYIIRSRDEETMLNITLQEMLRQYFGISIGGLDPLPRDESGVDVRRVFNIIRRVIMSQSGWDVEEQAIIGNFSFSKFIMWNDIHNNSDKLSRNKIVASLMSGKMEWTPPATPDETPELDEAYPAGDIALPIAADSSQLEAICAAVNDRSFILHGPPGTGKSQTITNIIANALYNGKKVLFVAEKMAALQVVQRRLEAIGLSPFCLELHSNKTKKSSILEQLKRTTEIVRRRSNASFRIKADEINALRRELNGTVRALHRKRAVGLSLYDFFAEYASADYDGPLATIARTTLEAATPASKIEAEAAVSEFQTLCNICGAADTHPLAGIGLTTYSASIRNEAADNLTALSDRLTELQKSLAEMSEFLHTDFSDVSFKQIEALKEMARILLDAESLPVGFLELANQSEQIARIEEETKIGLERDRLRDIILADFNRPILTADVDSWHSQWQESQSKWWLPRVLSQNKIKKQIKVLSKEKKSFSPEEIAGLFTMLEIYHTHQNRVETFCRDFSTTAGVTWNPDTLDWNRLSEGVRTATELYRRLVTVAGHSGTLKKIRRHICESIDEGLPTFREYEGEKLRTYIDRATAVEESCRTVSELLQTTALDSTDRNAIGHIRPIVDRWNANLDKLHDWVAYNIQREKIVGLGLEAILSLIESGSVTSDRVETYYGKSFAKSYAEFILDQEPSLSTFHGMVFENKIERFRALSREFEQLTREELFARLASTLPALQKEASQNSEVGILQRNISNGGRGTSIRKLFDQIPDLITRMCPCMLMSPISVAQYLDAGAAPFDLVIFDEASQMPTSEAVGAIARGHNVIVVGDPKQMPPTNFFSINTYDEDNSGIEDLESILDDCLALSLPSKYLLWHYRSKHESLIAFSNAKYYENKLLTFPSPDDLTTKVGWVYVEGIYDRGRTRQNRAEAEAIIEEIRQRLSDPEASKLSIGVVTFNTNQQSLIEDLLNDMFRQHPELEAVALEREEPIFIKNLENVQGDERDVILFSIGFGRDKDGKVALNFGPLNRDGGWRRLNVAVSRARYEMKVFSTLLAEQIDLNRTSAEGVAGLKAFLEYAEKGRSVLSSPQNSDHHTTDELLRSVAAELTDRGFTVRTNMGCSGYKIDLGIVDDKNPDKYIMGILLDGVHYQSARTATDRDITQPSVLLQLGWRLHRLWALDWWENRERAIGSIVEAINNARTNKGTPFKPVAPKVEPEIKRVAQPEDDDTDRSPVRPYHEADLSPETYCIDDFIAPRCRTRIIKKIKAIIEAEAPISHSLLCKRILAACNLRNTSRALNYLDDLLGSSQWKKTEFDTTFYWSADQNPETYNIYRPESSRDVMDIAPEEVAVAAVQILNEQGAIPETAMAHEVARLFSFTRMGTNITTSMNRGIAYALDKGRIIRSGLRLKLP